MFPRFDASATGEPLARGLPASPGAAVGAAVFDCAEAVRRHAVGGPGVLVRQETNPDDLPCMAAARAVLTSRGGKTSHAAVVARGMGKVCVCGAEDLVVDTEGRRLTTGDGTVVEFRLVRAEVDRILTEVSATSGIPVACPVGTMMELPRAAHTAGPIAEAAEFFSFGTNDLTPTNWGFSRDDVEAAFFSAYLDKGVFSASPFETIDRAGVGRLAETAVTEGRVARPALETGVCGEHGGDPESVHFFHSAGLDYVSCSPFRVPVARLEVAGRAALDQGEPDDSR